MILLSSQMDLYYNLRNISLAIFGLFLVMSIIYGAKVHILITVQRILGIEKRREIKKRCARGYKQGNTAARMRYIQQPSGKNSGTMPRREVNVVQAKTAKIAPSAVERTVSLDHCQETMVLSADNQETVVLSSEERVIIRKQKEIIVVHGEDII